MNHFTTKPYIPVPIRLMREAVECCEIWHYRWRKWESTTTIDDHGKRLFWAALAYRMGFGRLSPDPTIVMATFGITGIGVAAVGTFRAMKTFVEECPVPSMPFTPQVAPALAFPFMLAVLLSEVNVSLFWTVAVCLGVAILGLHKTRMFPATAEYLLGGWMTPEPEQGESTKAVSP